uniref:Uncharacterized protein n=1 Tax=Graphocephala atropunctata TaxID=36148 RepID=A0A1B6LZJ6_9HEMI
MANNTFKGSIKDVTSSLVNFQPDSENISTFINLLDELRKFCATETTYKRNILESVVHKKFLQSVQTFMLNNFKDCSKTEDGNENFRNFFLAFGKLSRSAIEVLPCRYLFSLKSAFTLMKAVVTRLGVKMNVENESVELAELILMAETSKKEECEREVTAEEINEIKSMTILPTEKDLYDKPPELRKNIVEGAYESVGHYITVQFNLLHEDFVAPLRAGITEYLSSNWGTQRKQSGVYFYHQVKILDASLDSGKLGHVIKLDKKVKWEMVSKFFIFGSLLLFTTNSFNSFFLGTVIEVDNKEQTIIVKLNEMHNDVCDNIYAEEYLVAASKVFFEPYLHVLTALQKMIAEEFPMEKYIVRVSPESKVPAYIVELGLTTYNMFGKTQVEILEPSWPKFMVQFNPSQHRAFQAALTSEFVVIQGPPGTGKTFLGLQIVETLLDNVPIDTPILVVCYKNHALDQFLEGILKKTQNIIRIGGRSKNKNLEKFKKKCS